MKCHLTQTILLMSLLFLVHHAAQQDFSFEIEAAKDRFVLGEMVTLTGKVTNVSAERKVLFRIQYKQWLYLSRDGKQLSRISGGGGGGLVNPFEPGKSLEVLARLQSGSAGEPGISLDQPGIYYIQAELETDVGETLQSNVIEIRIVEPEGTDAKVWELLRGEDGTHQDYYLLVSGGVIKNKELLKKFVSIVQSYSESVYTLALRKGLVQYFENQLNKQQLSEPEKAWYEAIRAEP